MKISLLIAFAIAFQIAIIECGPCDKVVVSYDGKDRKYSLKEIAETSWEVQNSGRTYRFGICKNIDYSCESTESIPRCTGPGNAGSCVSWDSWKRCFGKFNAHEFKATDNGLDLIYDDGDENWGTQNPYLMTIFHIKCDKGKSKLTESDFSIMESQDKIEITFSHRSGCHGRGGLSPGSIMLIIIFVTFSVYLIAGIIINIAVRQKSGAEVIPNWGFWKGCPSLIFDGFMFVINKIRGTPSTYSTL